MGSREIEPSFGAQVCLLGGWVSENCEREDTEVQVTGIGNAVGGRGEGVGLRMALISACIA